MQHGPPRLGEGPVRGVPQQQVNEGVGVLAGQVGRGRSEQVGPYQRLDPGEDWVGITEKCAERVGVEDLTDHRRHVDDPAQVIGQQVEPRREHGLHARGHGDRVEALGPLPPPAVRRHELAVVDQHRGQLLDEQRDALGCGHDSVEQSRADLGTQQLRSQLVAVAVRQWAQRHRERVQAAGPPTRPGLLELRTGHAHQQDRSTARHVGEVVQQVHQARLGPLHVVDHENHGPVCGQRLDQAAKRPCHLGCGGGPNAAHHRLQPGEDLVPVGDARHMLGERRRIGLRQGGQHLDRGPVGDALAIRQAPALQHQCISTDPGEQLLDQPRLADPRLAYDGEQDAGRLLDSGRVHRLGDSQLSSTSDERSGEPPPALPRPCRPDAQQPERDQRLRLALHHERLDGHGIDDVANQPVGGLPDQDLSCSGDLLQPGGDVRGIARHQGLAPAQHLPGVHADADGELHPDPRRQVFVQVLHLDQQLRRRAHRPKRVVLVHDRDPEHADHGVADELLDRPTVPLHH